MKRLGLLALVVVLAAAGAVVAAGSRAAVGGPQVTFTGGGVAYDLAGTFTLDHFEVKTPLSFPDVLPLYHPAPRLVAVGTTTATETPAFTTPTTWTDVPFVWVNLGLTAVCGGAVRAQFDAVGGSDYTGFGPIGGRNLWDDSVPLAPWDSSVHWGMESVSPAFTLTGTRGDSCAVAQLAGKPKTLAALAGALNRMLRETR